MAELPRISDVLLRVATDLGHGGHLSEYKINSVKGGFTVKLSITGTSKGLEGNSVPPPRPPSHLAIQSPAASLCNPLQMTEVIAKNSQQVEEFLRRLSTEFNVCALIDLKSSYPFLHPTFYTFSFQYSEGEHHSFEYHIECSNHLDEKYEKLIQEFDAFFESRRVFNTFIEQLRQNKY